MFNNDKNTFTFIYSDSSAIATEALEHLRNFYKKINYINLNNTNLRDDVWTLIANKLKYSNKDLMDFELAQNSHFKDLEMSEADWLNVLRNNPDILVKPILIDRNRCAQIHDPYNALTFFKISQMVYAR